MLRMERLDDKDCTRVKTLYTTAFPAAERAPFVLLRRRFQQNRADFWSFQDGQQWVGIAYVIRHEDMAYLFYLAIDAPCRGKGYGTQAIAALRKHYEGCRFFLALERLDPKADNYDQRIKRHAFYEHCGLVDLPYHIKEATVVYDIMGVGGSIEPDEYKALINQWLGWPWCKLIDMRIIV